MENLKFWLTARGYEIRHSGPYNPETDREWYSHENEYQRGHIRVRINGNAGIIILRDPGCTIQINEPVKANGGISEQITPNMIRIDNPYPLGNTIGVICEAIEEFEKRPAYTLEEAIEKWMN